VDRKYFVSKKLMNTLIKHKKRNIEKGNGFGFSLADRGGITNTLRSRYGKDGSKILIPKLTELTSNMPDAKRVYDTGMARTLKALGGGLGAKTGLYQTSKSQIRRLTPTECERLQGFPDSWTEGLSDSQRYKTLGNAVTSNVVTALLNEMFRNTEYERKLEK